MDDAGVSRASSTLVSSAEAEEALRKLELLVADLDCAEPAREAIERVRSALYVAHFHAHTDGLTRLMNRQCFGHALHAALARAERSREQGALLFVDLDDFKLVNDALGHQVGDEVLALSAQRMRDAVREGDLSARFGGDEFVAYLGDVGPETARVIAERVMASIEAPCATSAGAVRVAPSVGIALYPEHGRTPDELLRHADRAMYRAKSLGGAGCALYGAHEDAPNKSSASGAYPSPFSNQRADATAMRSVRDDNRR
jgi:diguanylate cyclase (GGDEF)-like protein